MLIKKKRDKYRSQGNNDNQRIEIIETEYMLLDLA